MKDIKARTFDFAVRVVKLCRHLEDSSRTASTVARQLLRSGTSIGANVQEAQAGQSKADFISKMTIALKEARETFYWLKLLKETEIVSTTQIENIENECDEITKVIASIIVSTKRNIK